MKAEIITINADLLRGQPLNTNVVFLTRELTSLGIPVQQSVMIHNRSETLKRALRSANDRADLVILVGGLGPDADDVTKTTISDYLNIPLKNVTGLATGYFYQHKEKTYILLPGPVEELKPMFTENTRPLIIEKLLDNQKIHTKIYSLYGLTLSEMNEKLGELISADGNPFIGVYYEKEVAKIHLTARASTEKEAKKLVDEVAEKVTARVGEYIYDDKDTRLAALVKHLLKEQNKKITAAESLTGGLFLSAISEESGASEIFDGGIVAYSNQIKQNVLKVTKETIDQYGVVSSQCAIEMAENSMEMFAADISLSLTGAAGPTSLEGKMPGTVWIGLAQKRQETFAKKFHFNDDRETNRRHAVLSALNLARLALLEQPIDDKVFFD